MDPRSLNLTLRPARSEDPDNSLLEEMVGAEVKKERQAFARAKKAWQRGILIQQDLREARNSFYRTIRRAKRECWQDFLMGNEGPSIKDRPDIGDTARCWTALRYTTPRLNLATPTLEGSQGQVATTIEEKETLIRETAFPAAPEADLAQIAQPGVMHQPIGIEQVRKAIFSQSVQKAPGVDKLNFRALRLLWELDAPRVIALVRQCFRLGTHPKAWKVARGILLQKPNKPDHTLVKAYRVISLLNCLGKIVEKLAAEAISTYCEGAQVLHPGQMGCRKRRSAIDAVACLIQPVAESASTGHRKIFARTQGYAQTPHPKSSTATLPSIVNKHCSDRLCLFLINISL
jgi:hypothetical protein